MSAWGKVLGLPWGKTRKEEPLEIRTLTMDIASLNAVDIHFKDIVLTVQEGIRNKKKKTILRGVSGEFHSGQLTGILGPSGAGKTSLLNALTAFSTTGVRGTVRAGDAEVSLSSTTSASALRAYRKKSCYILQDDRLSPLFTVMELLRFAADVKLGYSLTAPLKEKVVCEVLETLGLWACRHTRCGRLSGGQRKRLSIAAELIDNPPVVFLDEPTTGLDSTTAAQCVGLLKQLARSGRTVVCTIHQPSASLYSLFDQVYILAAGVCVYNGSSENTVPFLSSVSLPCPTYYNPADYMLEIANGEYGNYIDFLSCECTKRDWRTRTRGNKGAVPTPPTAKRDIVATTPPQRGTVAVSPPHELYRFFVLVKRCMTQQYRDWTVTHLRVGLHACIGVLLGLLFTACGSDGSRTISNLGFCIVSLAYLAYTSLMPAVLRFPSELPVLKKENFNNWYKLHTYYAAVLLTSMPVQIWYAVVYGVPAFVLSGQQLSWARFLPFTLVLALVTLLADAVGNVIGTLLNPINGTFIGAISICAMILFSGFLVLFPHMSATMELISRGTYLRYAFEGLVLALYNDRAPLICPEDEIYCHLRYPKLVLETFALSADNYWCDVGALVAMTLAVRVVAYVTLRRHVRRSC